MPIASPITTPLFLAQFSSNGIIGVAVPQLAQAVAMGLELYASTGLLVQSVDVGTLGAGAGTGVGMIIPPPALIGALTGTFASNGLIGVMVAPTVIAIATGLSTALGMALVTTVSAGVGVGAGVATLIPNPGASAAAWLAGFASAGLVGVNVPQMANAIAQGFDMVAPTAIGAVVIAGPPSIVPGAGAGIGQLK